MAKRRRTDTPPEPPEHLCGPLRVEEWCQPSEWVGWPGEASVYPRERMLWLSVTGAASQRRNDARRSWAHDHEVSLEDYRRLFPLGPSEVDCTGWAEFAAVLGEVGARG